MARKTTHLAPAELKHFKKLLLVKRKALVANLTDLQTELEQEVESRRGEGLSSLPTHMADVGSDNYEQDVELGLIQSERAKIQRIDEALERIEAGTYGICLATGKPIAKTRLEAKPWAQYCVEHARKAQEG